MSKAKMFEVRGTVRGKESGRGMPGLLVEALDRDLLHDDRLGAVFTDQDGNFRLRYSPAAFEEVLFDKQPDLYLRVLNPQGHELVTTEKNVRWQGGNIEEFGIEVAEASFGGQEEGGVSPLGQFEVVGEPGRQPIVSLQINPLVQGKSEPRLPDLYRINVGLCTPRRERPEQFDIEAEVRLDPEEVMPKFRVGSIQAFRQPGTAISLMPGPVGGHIESNRGHTHDHGGDAEVGEGEEKPSTVFGVDQRYFYYDLAYPWRTMGRIDTASGFCSGCIIGPRHVLTASHCIPWKSGGGAGWVQFTPHYYNGSGPWGTYNAKSVSYWRKNSGSLNHEEIAFDYVVLVFDEYIGNNLGWLGSKTYSSAWDDAGYWSHVGYPGDLDPERPTFQSSCAIDSRQTFGDGQALRHLCDIKGGHSGGPVFGWWSGLPYAIGVQSTETSDHNEYGGGEALPTLINWARSNFP